MSQADIIITLKKMGVTTSSSTAVSLRELGDFLGISDVHNSSYAKCVQKMLRSKELLFILKKIKVSGNKPIRKEVKHYYFNPDY